MGPLEDNFVLVNVVFCYVSTLRWIMSLRKLSPIWQETTGIVLIMVFCYWPSYVVLLDAYNNRPYCMVEQLTCRNNIDP